MLLDTLTDQERAAIEKIANRRKFSEGTEILKEGEAGASLFLIRGGVVEVRKLIDKEKYKQLRDLSVGDFFGEMSFLTGAPRSATVLALHEADVLEIPRDAFDQLVKEQPSIGLKLFRNIAQELARRLRRNNEELKTAILWAIDEMIC